MTSTQTHRTCLKVVDGWPGFTYEAVEHLKQTHQVKGDGEKLCSIMLDGMTIRKKCHLDSKSGKLIGYDDFGNRPTALEADDAPLATDALVLMAVGLAAPWKISFGYFLDSGLSGRVPEAIVAEAVQLLEECNLEVVAVVCDGLASNMTMTKIFCYRTHEETAANFQTSFPHPKDPSRKISLIFDAAHGLKLLRNLPGDKKIVQSTEYGVSSLLFYHVALPPAYALHFCRQFSGS